jgi:hypothetical protein
MLKKAGNARKDVFRETVEPKRLSECNIPQRKRPPEDCHSPKWVGGDYSTIVM